MMRFPTGQAHMPLVLTLSYLDRTVVVLLGGAKLILHLSSPTDRPARPRGPGSDPGPADRPTRSGPADGDTGGSGVADRPTVPGRRWAEMRGRC